MFRNLCAHLKGGLKMTNIIAKIKSFFTGKYVYKPKQKPVESEDKRESKPQQEETKIEQKPEEQGQ